MGGKRRGPGTMEKEGRGSVVTLAAMVPVHTEMF